jgi:hypothetical protein
VSSRNFFLPFALEGAAGVGAAPADGTAALATWIASCRRGARPPTDMRAVCLVRAILEKRSSNKQKTRAFRCHSACAYAQKKNQLHIFRNDTARRRRTAGSTISRKSIENRAQISEQEIQVHKLHCVPFSKSIAADLLKRAAEQPKQTHQHKKRTTKEVLCVV